MTNSLFQARKNGYYVFGKNNSPLVCEQLDALGFIRYDSLPRGGVKFNWISRNRDIDWRSFDSKFQIINHISDEGHLSNKGLLYTHLKELASKTAFESFLPDTYLLDHPTDRVRFRKVFREGSTWICKPVGLSCGREIFLFRTEEQLNTRLATYPKSSSFSTEHSNRLVQKYLENPLLIHRRKFDIRTYFLCICTSKELLCFAAQTGYLRLSISEFHLDDSSQFVHLTNQSIQRKHSHFSAVRNSTGMTMEDFNRYFNEFVQPNMSHVKRDWVIEELPKKITEILRQVADSIRTKISIREGCFGFYGVDILIDATLNCWLLEINSGPTLDMTNVALEKVIPMCLHEAISLVIDSLDKHRSSVFPSCQSSLFKYLPPSMNSLISPKTFYSFSMFSSLTNRRLNLTPETTHIRSSLSKKVKLTSVKKNRSSIVRNISKKVSPPRKSSCQVTTELIPWNNKVHQQKSTFHSTHILPISTNSRS